MLVRLLIVLAVSVVFCSVSETKVQVERREKLHLPSPNPKDYVKREDKIKSSISDIKESQSSTKLDKADVESSKVKTVSVRPDTDEATVKKTGVSSFALMYYCLQRAACETCCRRTLEGQALKYAELIDMNKLTEGERLGFELANNYQNCVKCGTAYPHCQAKHLSTTLRNVERYYDTLFDKVSVSPLLSEDIELNDSKP